jgi:hypothetical protein
MVLYRDQIKTKTVFFAPYLLTTHSCYTHNSNCQGELVDTNFSYNVLNFDKNINLNGSISTGVNGFFELTFLTQKRYEISVNVTINGTSYNASSLFSTYPDSADCITTLQLV